MKNKILYNKINRFLKKIRPPASPAKVSKAEQIFYINYLSQGMIVFDIGANVGELSLLFSKFVGRNGQVHAFEPSKAEFEKLDTICRLASRSQVILNNKAVAEAKGTVKLYVYEPEHSTLNSLANRPLEKYGINIKPNHVEEIEATTIDEYCREKNISKIDLLKIDVEGAEYQVLRGAEKMLREHKISCCVFEFGQTTFDMGNTPEEIELLFKEVGYKIKNIVNGYPVFPGRSSAREAQFSIHVAVPQ
jgi:FkbM family methyltransferase